LLTRIFSATCSLISVWLFYRIALKVFHQKIAILTTFIAATTVGLIQYAHYGVTESLLVMEVLLLSLLSMQLMKNKKKINLFWLALVFGVSVGTKTSALSFILSPALAILMTYGWHWRTILMGVACVLVAAQFFMAFLPTPFSI
jgi:4-amino-4-deoxy-L-arabinose transferase-like glycosyltransferase